MTSPPSLTILGTRLAPGVPLGVRVATADHGDCRNRPFDVVGGVWTLVTDMQGAAHIVSERVRYLAGR